MLRILFSVLLMGLTLISCSGYRQGIKQQNADRLLSRLAGDSVKVDAIKFDHYLDGLNNSSIWNAGYSSWQIALLNEWKGDSASLLLARHSIAQSKSFWPSWPMIWRDDFRVELKMGLSSPQRIDKIRHQMDISPWHKQALSEYVRLLLPHWQKLSSWERSWIDNHAIKAVGPKKSKNLILKLTQSGVLDQDVCKRFITKIFEKKASKLIKKCEVVRTI